MSDFLKTKRDEIAARLRELEPLVEEYRQLEAAASALAELPGATRTPRAAQPQRLARRHGRRRGAARTASTPRARTTRARAGAGGGRRGRPRGSGTRALQTLELVKAQPGITIPEIASAMGIKQNYLYRVLPGSRRTARSSSATAAGTPPRPRKRRAAGAGEEPAPRGGVRSGQQPELADGLALLDQLGRARIDARARERRRSRGPRRSCTRRRRCAPGSPQSTPSGIP